MMSYTTYSRDPIEPPSPVSRESAPPRPCPLFYLPGPFGLPEAFATYLQLLLSLGHQT